MSSRLQPSRRRFVAAGGALAAFSIARPGVSAAQFEYKCAHGLPVDDPMHAVLLAMWEAVKTETGGRLAVTTFPSNQLAAQNQIVTQVRLGAVQFCLYANSAFSGVVPPVTIDSVGYVFSSPAQAWRAMDGPLGAYVRDQFVAHGLFALSKKYESGMRQVTTSTKPIRTAQDMTGLKICVPPANLSVDLFKTLGAAPAPIPSNEWYTSLQTHLVDGVDCPLRTTDSFKLFEVQHYLSITNHSWDAQWVVANAAAWTALPADIQAIVLRNQAVNTADAAGMRAKLGEYYSRAKADFGSTAWNLLEAAAGKLPTT